MKTARPILVLALAAVALGGSCRVGYDAVASGGAAGEATTGGASGSGSGEAGGDAQGGSSQGGSSGNSGNSGTFGGTDATGGEGGEAGTAGTGTSGGSAGTMSTGGNGNSGGQGGAAGSNAGGGVGGSAGAGAGGSNAGGGAGGSAGAGAGGSSAGGGVGGSAGAGAGGMGGSAGAPDPGLCNSATFGGHTYSFCREQRNFWAANDGCTALGMRLVRINDAPENQWLFDTAKTEFGSMASVWIGATDQAVEGEWRWTDGTLFWIGGNGGMAQGGLFTAWYFREPNDVAGVEHCGSMETQGSDPEWYDWRCETVQPFVCESL